jgi:hypothetical protein
MEWREVERSNEAETETRHVAVLHLFRWSEAEAVLTK